MAFIAEDGTGLETSNSYLTVEFANDYFTDINYQESWFSKSTEERERALMNATFFIDNQYIFPGYRSNKDQSLQWPRTDAFDRDGYELTEIPKILKYATCEAALKTLTETLFQDKGRKGDVKREKVDVIEVEYIEGTERTNPYTAISQMLFQKGIAIRNVGEIYKLRVIRT